MTPPAPFAGLSRKALGVQNGLMNRARNALRSTVLWLASRATAGFAAAAAVGKWLSVRGGLRWVGRLLGPVWTFASSRRWLVASVLITCGLLAFVLIAPPAKPVERSAEEPQFALGEVRIELPGASGGFRSASRGENRAGDRGPNSLGPSDGRAAGSIETADHSEASQISRRLDAVRSRQARGAWLLGTIEEIADASPRPGKSQASEEQRTAPSRRNRIAIQAALPTASGSVRQ